MKTSSSIYNLSSYSVSLAISALSSAFLIALLGLKSAPALFAAFSLYLAISTFISNILSTGISAALPRYLLSNLLLAPRISGLALRHFLITSFFYITFFPFLYLQLTSHFQEISFVPSYSLVISPILMSIYSLLSFSAQGFNRKHIFSLSLSLQPALLLLLFLFSPLLSSSPSDLIFILHPLSFLLSIVILTILLRSHLSLASSLPYLNKLGAFERSFYSFAFPIFISLIISLMGTRLSLLMATQFLDSGELAAFSLLVFVLDKLSLPISAFNYTVYPRLIQSASLNTLSIASIQRLTFYLFSICLLLSLLTYISFPVVAVSFFPDTSQRLIINSLPSMLFGFIFASLCSLLSISLLALSRPRLNLLSALIYSIIYIALLSIFLPLFGFFAIPYIYLISMGFHFVLRSSFVFATLRLSR